MAVDVDHINDMRTDDYIDNLQLLSRTDNYLKHVDNVNRIKEQTYIDNTPVRNLIIALYKDNKTYDEIANITKIPKWKVYEFIVESGIEKKTTFIYNDAEIQYSIIQDYQNNVPVKELIEKYQKSHSAIMSVINNAILNGAIILKRKKVINGDLTKSIITLYEQNKSINEICQELNVSPSTVRNVVVKEQVPTRYKKAIPKLKSNEEFKKNFSIDYESGKYTNKELSEKYHIGIDSVNRYANLFGLKKKRLCLTDNERTLYHKEIIDAYENTDIGINALSEKYQLVPEAIRKIVKSTKRYQNEVVLKEIHHYRTIYKLRQEGLSLGKIAEQLAMSKSNVANYIEMFHKDDYSIQQILAQPKCEPINYIFKDKKHFLKIQSVTPIQKVTLEKPLSEKSGYLVTIIT